ncbi:MAG: hypothetical protein R6V03_06665 [Kiritimatiellia bacterium]
MSRPNILFIFTDDPAYAEVRQSLQCELETWRTELNDTGEMGQAFWSVARA